ncbi:MAG TPA: hypothetical protein VK061_09100 [Bacillota bacterium]|nr:hypothetical protein [Bacillota bacterium]
MKRQFSIFSYLMLILFFLSGCLSTNSDALQAKMPTESQIVMVQTAVEQFQEENNGILPILTMPEGTPVYEKYIIDFKQLKNENYIGELPSSAFERGGYFQYALIDVEENPTVKLIDVRTSQKLQQIYNRLNIYLEKNNYLPLLENITGNYFELDFDKLGYKEEQYVESPYSGQELPIIIDNKGILHIDYRVDIHREMQEHNFEQYEDIRNILTDHYPYIPAYSPNYTIEDDYPIIISKD